jgi:hypothetical protein
MYHKGVPIVYSHIPSACHYTQPEAGKRFKTLAMKRHVVIRTLQSLIAMITGSNVEQSTFWSRYACMYINGSIIGRF